MKRCFAFWAALSLSCGSASDAGLYGEKSPGTANRLDSNDALATAPGATEAPESTTMGDGTTSDDTDAPTSMTSAAESVQSGSGTLPSDSATPEANVLFTVPGDGDRGLHADTEVVIQFSEAMDAPSVQRALVTTLPGAVEMRWEGDGSALRIHPAALLPYADGTHGDPAQTFSVAISGEARSASGKALHPRTLSFSTLRRFALQLTPLADPDLTGTLSSQPLSRALITPTSPTATGPDAGPRSRRPTTSAAPAVSELEPCVSADAICVGDVPSRQGDWMQLKGFLSFDLSALPASVELDAANLTVVTEALLGAPFATPGGLGRLNIERSHFTSIDSAAFNANPDATLGVFAAATDSVQSGDIRWVIDEARAQGITQYRLVFPQTTNRDATADLVLFDPAAQRLDIAYLLP